MKSLALYHYISVFVLLSLINKTTAYWWGFNPDSNWMSHISGDLKLNQINIPGTHDSGMYSVKELYRSFAQTQDKNIIQQLEMGVRYFDLRLAWSNNDIIISHGTGGLFNVKRVDAKHVNGKDLTLDIVLRTCRDYLSTNKKETIIAHLKIEDSTYKDKIINKVKSTYKSSSLYYTKNKIPSLRDVRGKIVIANRDGYYGISLPINSLPKNVNYNEYKCINNNNKCRTCTFIY